MVIHNGSGIGDRVEVRAGGATDGTYKVVLDVPWYDIGLPGHTEYTDTLRSSTFTASQGSVIAFDWRVVEDWDDPYARAQLFNADTHSLVRTFFKGTFGGSTGWAEASHAISTTGNYYLEFQGGSDDADLFPYPIIIGAELWVDNIHFNNLPPVADANGPYSAPEGTPITFDASGSTDPDGDLLYYRWDFESDGTWDTPWTPNPKTTHQWGDDWSGTATVDVRDGITSRTDTAPVTVHNVAPTMSLDTAEAIVFGDGEAFLGRVGVAQSHNVSATDPGSDALTFDWDFEVTPASHSYYVDPTLDPDGADPPGSQGVAPRDVTDTAQLSFTDPGVYTITVEVKDDDGGSGLVTFTKLVTGDMEEVKTQGFWRHQMADKKKQHIQDEALLAYLDIANFASRVFSEEVPLASLEDARDVFQPGGPDVGDPHRSNMKGKATQQSLAAWLNFASGAIQWDEIVPTGDLFSEAIMEIEDILLDLDGDYEHADYVLAQHVASAINEMDD
jgi:hypothetical protein